MEWNETNYDFTKNQYMKEAFEAKKWGFVPDYARLDIVYQYGGIYLDVDVEIVKSFDSLLNYSGFAGFESPEFINFGQGFGAEPGNLLIKKIRDDYDNLHFLNEDGTPNFVASPHINTKVLEENGVKRNGTFQIIDNFAFLPMDYLCPKSFEDGIIKKTNNTYSIHHFDASWHDKKTKKYYKNRRRQLRKERRMDYIIHIPNKLMIVLLGKNNYEKFKSFIKKCR